METLFDLSPFWMGVSLGALPLGVAVVLQLVTQHSPLKKTLRKFSGGVGELLSAVALLFGLFAAFLAADVWERIREKHHSAEREIAAIQTIDAITDALGEAGVKIQLKLRHYAEASRSRNRPNSDDPSFTAADEALEGLVQAIVELSRSRAIEGPVQSAMLAAYHNIKLARAQRLHVDATSSDPHKWLVVILLGFLTQMTIVVLHVERPKAQAAALALFSLAFAVTLTTLASHERTEGEPQLAPINTLHRWSTDSLNRR